MLTYIFEKDWNSKVYEEFSKLSTINKIKGIRLNPLNDVKNIIDKDRASLIILKPLVETQHILKLLNYFDTSKAIWLFRNYMDVAASNLKKFGINNGINNLRPIVLSEPNNWRSENIPDEIRDLVLKYFSEDMKPYDAAALFWYVRNSFFFSQNLDTNPRIFLCRYDDLVKDPSSTLRKIYDFADEKFPGEKITREVKTSSIGKGIDIDLSEPIASLCKGLMKRINDVYHTKQESAVNWGLPSGSKFVNS